jgi:membrane-bound lytic murein transglycosylase A
MSRHILIIAAASLALSACGGRIVPPSNGAPAPEKRTATQPRPVAKPAPRPAIASPAAVPIPATPIAAAQSTTAAGPNALSSGVIRAPAFDSPPYTATSASRALKAFRSSCASLLKRKDMSGLTSNDDWRPACSAAASWPEVDAVGYFQQNFDMAQIGDGKAFATGYYEPQIDASRIRQPGYETPIYKRPPELVEIDLGDFSDQLKGKKLRGKIAGNTFVPLPDRAQIEDGALAGRGLELAWAKDPVALFFLQVQGSGRLGLPDGTIVQIGYDSQNGRDYTGIGKLMRDRGLLAPGKASMQGISEWMAANPEQGKSVMRENRSWVFFKELSRMGALGALNVPVAPRGSVAADPMFIPLGAPVFLSMDRAEPNGLWVAQDTGGAIKGANRVDTFWGAGDEAERIAGGMSAHGTAFLLLPKGVLDRLLQDPRNGSSIPKP